MTDDLTLNMNAYLPLRDVVFNTLREAILKGDLKPGERLMELQLASKLGVSRTPIREAIRMLEQEGLAVTTPRKGAEVAKMTLKDMEDVLEIRDALDELAVRIACQKISDEQLKQLEDMKELFEKSTQTGNVKKIAEADVTFQRRNQLPQSGIFHEDIRYRNLNICQKAFSVFTTAKHHFTHFNIGAIRKQRLVCVYIFLNLRGNLCHVNLPFLRWQP